MMTHHGMPLIACSILGATFAAVISRADTPVTGADEKHRVVVDVAADGNEQWSYALNNIENLRKAFGLRNVEIEVVGHGKGLGMLVTARTDQKDRIKSLADDGVLFRACENSMRKTNVSKADLLPLVQTVDSGVAELVRKQETGWSYLKAGS